MSYRKPPLVPQVTTLWEYPSQHYGDSEQGSSAYRGATPSWVIWNVLHRFSAPGDTVVDPFCGSGTTLDVCRDLGRHGIGFDLAPHRPDIAQADARSLPLKAGSAHVVFMDPPYADNLDYSDDPRCIGRLPANGRYQRAMRLVIAEAARVLKEDGVLAIYVCDVFKKDRGFYPLGFELFDIARPLFMPLDIVSVVRHNRTLNQGNYRKAADEQGFFLRGFNWLLLLRKRRKPLTAGAPDRMADDDDVFDTMSEKPATRGARPSSVGSTPVRKFGEATKMRAEPPRTRVEPARTREEPARTRAEPRSIEKPARPAKTAPANVQGPPPRPMRDRDQRSGETPKPGAPSRAGPPAKKPRPGPDRR